MVSVGTGSAVAKVLGFEIVHVCGGRGWLACLKCYFSGTCLGWYHWGRKIEILVLNFMTACQSGLIPNIKLFIGRAMRIVANNKATDAIQALNPSQRTAYLVKIHKQWGVQLA